MTTAEITVPFRMTRLERFALSSALANEIPEQPGREKPEPNARARKDLDDLIQLTEGNEVGLNYRLEEDRVEPRQVDDAVEIKVITKRQLSDLKKLCDSVAPSQRGRLCFALMDLGDRAAWVLEPKEKDS